MLAESRLPVLLVDRADVLARLGRPDEALETLESARLEFPELTVYGRALLGGLLEKAGRAEEAHDVFEALAYEPRLDAASARRVARHFSERGEAEHAVALLRRQEADTPARCGQLARSLTEAGHAELALAELARGVQLWPEDEALFEQWVRARLEGQPPEVVVEELEVLIATRPGHARLRGDLALALRKAGHAAQARELLLDLLETSPGNTFWLGHLAHCCRDLGEPEKAAEVLEEVLLQNPLDKIARTTYFAACREAGLKERAAAFVAEHAARDPNLRRWWGDFRKAFRES